MFEPMMVWARSVMESLTPKGHTDKGEPLLLDCVDKMNQCLDIFDEYGTIPDEDLADLIFKLEVYHYEKYATGDEE